MQDKVILMLLSDSELQHVIQRCKKCTVNILPPPGEVLLAKILDPIFTN